MLSVPLRYVTPLEAPVRRGEPVSVGFPWPRGAVRDERCFRLIGPDGGERPLQTQVTDRWGDGSIRWCLFDLLADVDETKPEFRIEVGEPREVVVLPPPDWQEEAIQLIRNELSLVLSEDKVPLIVRSLSKVSGIIRNRCTIELVANSNIEITCIIDVYINSPTAKYQLTLRNVAAASHPGGTWDLGNAGSILIHGLQIKTGTALEQIFFSLDRGEEFETCTTTLDISQFASGGENWKSTNHITRKGMPCDYERGYLFNQSLGEHHAIGRKGNRATPVVIYGGEKCYRGFCMPEFWESFPKQVVADPRVLQIDLMPFEAELQGGEQKTHTFYIGFGKDNITDEPMVWCRSPLLCHADPEWYAASGAIPYLTPKSMDGNAAYLALVDQAIEGPDTFFHKREKIDEYGWRNFGDVYADHEAVRHTGPEAMVSHYNNQYDCVAGFAYQFFRSADPRWWELFIPCATHTADIDIYHTDGDKPAYNRGMFWHTYHYAAADTSTHRSYPKRLTQGPVDSLTSQMDKLGDTAGKLQSAYQVGGGPSASHCYSTGLMLAYFVTGNPIYRESVLDLAGHILRMEDPAGTPFRFLSREYTGLASDSQAGYHGPGRASGNAISVLLDGHRVSGEQKYLDMAERLIRRVSSPKQDLDTLDLLNAEERWFYTVHLQAVGKYLDHKRDLGQFDRNFMYARLTLLHYARWMAEHERPILDTPERLQYPTETWAAQEMRKVEVFQFAALQTSGAERDRFLDRAEWFFRYVERTLSAFPTKSLARPVVLMLSFGWSRAWWQSQPCVPEPESLVNVTPEECAEWRMFVPQKAIAIRRAKKIVVTGSIVFTVIMGWLIWYLL